MRDHGTRRPIPVEQSIHWKPLHDPHYVVASLQPGDGGRRPIFVRQQVLARVEALVRAHGRRAYGLLIGQFYHCSVTSADYIIVESVAEQGLVSDEMDMAAGITEAIADRSAEQRAHIVGWYRGVPTVEAKPSPNTASTHMSLFQQPWHVALVVGEGADISHGALFLRDTVNSRWFHAPFYELLEQAPAQHEPKPTVVDWPHHYITAESVVPARLDVIAPTELADARAKSKYDRPKPGRQAADRSATSESEAEWAPAPLADVAVPLSLSAPESVAPAPIDSRVVESTKTEPAIADAPLATDRLAPRTVHRELVELAQTTRERALPRERARAVEKLSIVDDRDQRSVASGIHRLSDTDDTVIGDDPGRYIELARAEGFFIAAKFETMNGLGSAETLWVLNEPYSGMLLAVVTTDSEVVDATLHCNLQTDDAGLRRVPFPEHRDPESKTIYVRETCVDSLRARCRRLRATNSLLKEWKVTPKISFLTPGEWESVPTFDAGSSRGIDTISQLNNARIAELPAGVRMQFHIAGGAEADQANA